MKNLKVLIMGSDANAYHMARSCYEEYQIKAHLIGKTRLAFTKFSNILTIEYNDNLWNEDKFVQIVNQYAKNNKDDNVLLISTNETYSGFIANSKSKLENNLYYFNQDVKVLESLTNKEKFYKTYKKSILRFPETYYFDVLKDQIIPSMEYPVVLKPSNVVKYNHISFEDKHKIYKLYQEDELRNVIKTIKDAGYDDRLIIQEFIPGDDSYLFDAVVYVDRKGVPKMISFANIGIQERSKTMVGNAAALINGFNPYDGNVEEMKKNILSFMSELKMNGIYEFDMKYDARDKTFKVLEINARQGRCSYYTTPLGANLVNYMVRDLIEKEDIPFNSLDDEYLLSFVPKNIIKKYVVNDSFKKRALFLWNKKRVSPMECPLDKNFKRFLMMKKRLWHYKKEYQNSYWEE